ncbi:MAG: hypothetical protein ACKO3N_17925 [Verrucomicrobiota bacterium]
MPEEVARQGPLVVVTRGIVFVLDAVGGNAQWQDMLRKHLGERGLEDPLIPALIERRRGHFADDLRLISAHRLTVDADG